MRLLTVAAFCLLASLISCFLYTILSGTITSSTVINTEIEQQKEELKYVIAMIRATRDNYTVIFPFPLKVNKTYTSVVECYDKCTLVTPYGVVLVRGPSLIPILQVRVNSTISAESTLQKLRIVAKRVQLIPVMIQSDFPVKVCCPVATCNMTTLTGLIVVKTACLLFRKGTTLKIEPVIGNLIVLVVNSRPVQDNEIIVEGPTFIQPIITAHAAYVETELQVDYTCILPTSTRIRISGTLRPRQRLALIPGSLCLFRLAEIGKIEGNFVIDDYVAKLFSVKNNLEEGIIAGIVTGNIKILK